MTSMRRPVVALVLVWLAVACSTAQSTVAPTTAPSLSPSTSSTTILPTTTTTSPPLESTYVVIGDFGGGTEAEYEVAAAIEALAEEQSIDGLITTGDNFYSDDFERIWTIPYGVWLEEEGIPVFAAWGNHDLVSATRRQLVEEHLRPPGRWYSRDIGPGTLVVLDSNDVGNAEQTTWLSRTLEDADPPIVVAFHHPAFSCGMHGNTQSVIDQWVPLFEEHGVVLVLNGHDHDYQRFEHNGVAYVVTGGGGQAIRPPRTCSVSTPIQLEADNEHNHFVVLQVGVDEIVGTSTAADGTIIDRFAVETGE